MKQINLFIDYCFLVCFQEGNQRGVHRLRMNSNQTLYIKVGDRITVVLCTLLLLCLKILAKCDIRSLL